MVMAPWVGGLNYGNYAKLESYNRGKIVNNICVQTTNRYNFNDYLKDQNIPNYYNKCI